MPAFVNLTPQELQETFEPEEIEELEDQLWTSIEEVAKHGYFLVREEDWTEYVRDMYHGISDLDIIDHYVDWDRAAEGYQQDATLIEIGGTEYWLTT